MHTRTLTHNALMSLSMSLSLCLCLCLCLCSLVGPSVLLTPRQPKQTDPLFIGFTFFQRTDTDTDTTFFSVWLLPPLYLYSLFPCLPATSHTHALSPLSASSPSVLLAPSLVAHYEQCKTRQHRRRHRYAHTAALLACLA